MPQRKANTLCGTRPGAVLPAILLHLCLVLSVHAQQWVTPGVSAPRVQRVVFASASVGAPVSYHVYTPAAYAADPARRFPVLYWLHGTNSVLTGISPMSSWFDSAISSGRIPPMIVVFPNGLGTGMWCNWAAQPVPVEDMVIRDLLPEVDARFRTIAARHGRIIEGFSMGGYGAARLGFRYNHLFGGISMLAAGPLQLDFTLDQPGSPVSPAQRAQIFQDVYGNDPAIFLAQSPWMLAELNRPALLAAGTPIRQLIGGADFTLPANLDFHARMDALSIPHGFFNPPGIGHDVLALFGAYGEANWAFYRSVFDPPAAPCVSDIAGPGGTRPGDGTVDGSDFIAFINSFSIGDTAVDSTADIAGGGAAGTEPDGTVDGSDFIAFINAFSLGC